MRALLLGLLLPASLGLAAETNAVEEAPEPTVTLSLRQGFAALRESRNDEAMTHLRAALKTDPGNRAAKYGISSALIQQNKVREAQAVLESLMAQFPDDFVLKNNAAWLYATTTNRAFRNPARAVELARDALLLAPDNVHVWSTLADAHYAAGEFDKAVRASAQALRCAQRPDAAVDPATYQDQLKRMERAQQAFSLVE